MVNHGFLPLRPPATIMRLERMGAFHQTRLSFVRTIVRKMAREQWQIQRARFDLNNDGIGDCIYTIHTPNDELYTLVIFAQYLEDSRRSDRVIAEAWNVAFCLCEGAVTEDDLAELRANIPKQEAGRSRANVLVLSRANKSVRNFNYFVEKLAAGQQPDPAVIAKVGYLYRTTAVYGNGKFGLADYDKILQRQAFDLPFSVQMFTVYMLRQFSIDQVNHIAAQRNPEQAVPLDDRLARYLGIGNSTGLGMAPFLVHHPQLINQWMLMRETALARVIHSGEINPFILDRFTHLIQRARTHVTEFYTDDARQDAKNRILLDELNLLEQWVADNRRFSWHLLVDHAAAQWSLETQEMIVSILLELYPELVDELEQTMGVVESQMLMPEMSADALKTLMETRYRWALDIDFSKPDAQHFFWYRSAEKEEPRLGIRGEDHGDEKEARIDIARAVQHCYESLCLDLDKHPQAKVAHFLLHHPHHRGIVGRIQRLAQTEYGDIQDNLLDKNCLPLDLLRRKLSFFGASKFDPKSALWLRITLFQGAPLLADLAAMNAQAVDDWFMPNMPIIMDN